MGPSVDGRIVVDDWRITSRLLPEYERTARTFRADAWMIGRVSMEPYAGKAKVPKRSKGSARIPRTDFVAPHRARTYVVALDPSGKLGWEASDVDGEHVVAVLTEAVSDDYLAFLRAKGVSYVFGGKKDIDLRRVLEALTARFGIRKLLLEGGGKINGSFLAANLIDELSLLMIPVADGAVGTPSLFDVTGRRRTVRHLRLLAVRKAAADMVWLRYRVRR
jgi:riboflavin biosynthesis pyrimidine reductase